MERMRIPLIDMIWLNRRDLPWEKVQDDLNKYELHRDIAVLRAPSKLKVWNW